MLETEFNLEEALRVRKEEGKEDTLSKIWDKTRKVRILQYEKECYLYLGYYMNLKI